MRIWVAILGLSVLTACGDKDPRPEIEVSAAWARPTVSGQVAGVAYLTINNAGAVDRLVGIETEIAGTAVLHVSETVEGVARMRPMTALAIPKDVPVMMAPGGLHIMLFELVAPLDLNAQFELALIFEKAGAVQVTVEIRPGGDWQRSLGNRNGENLRDGGP
ncbi:MAG: copper chaperone PCu(A)C [Alphaproteobacteria bacterium]|nr:copper chaperone PCu(A)C [Alphaproteobacteria bacterium]